MLCAALDVLLSFVAAFGLSAFLGPPLIRRLKRSQWRQYIRDDGPPSHASKSGIPSMGGILIILALCGGVLIVCPFTHTCFLLFSLVILCGLLGFLDDYYKAFFRRSLGIKARYKLLALFVFAAFLGFAALRSNPEVNQVLLPGITISLSPGIFLFLSLFTVLLFTNAVNLTDGLDGLAAGCCALVGSSLAAFLFYLGKLSEAAFCGALVGACLGFLLFNAHPAKVFMGDTGAMALGGALAGISILSGTQLFLFVVGLVFVIEALSVAAQVCSFKLTGKRILKMSPLHHHFELKGISEVQVVRGFWAFTAVCCLLAAVLI